MLTSTKDIINRASFSVHFETQSDAFAAREKLVDLFDSVVKPALEKALGDFNREPGVIYEIDRLAIDIGELGLDPTAYSHYSQDILFQKVYSNVVMKLASMQHSSELSNVNDGDKLQTHPHGDAFITAYISYLKTGVLPWQFTYQSIADIEQTISDFDNQQRANFYEQLKIAFNLSICSERFIYQHSDSFFNAVVANFQPLLRSSLAEFFRPGGSPGSNSQNFNVANNSYASKALAITCCVQHKQAESQAVLLKTLHHLHGAWDNDEVTIETKPLALVRKAEISESDGETSTDKTMETTIEKTFIDNGGIILCHPFFVDLFDTLGLLNKGKGFRSTVVANKAVFLLHHLVSSDGNSDSEKATIRVELDEHKAGLYKILCGIDIHQPIPHQQILSVEEAFECEELLKAVIKHWGVLKSTSPAGIRDAFLQRQAKLFYQNDCWHLQVEHKAQDLLLEKLPWPLSIIKLPWLKRMISVEWIL